VLLQVNGESFSTTGKAAVLEVEARKRYRLRTICGTSSWGLTVAIDRHNITVIALDGQPIQPVTAQAFRCTPGERVDFVLAAGEDLLSENLVALL
jgi:FtsP/CotA-like multicopper oxidase with cupredoxin domain